MTDAQRATAHALLFPPERTSQIRTRSQRWRLATDRFQGETVLPAGLPRGMPGFVEAVQFSLTALRFVFSVARLRIRRQQPPGQCRHPRPTTALAMMELKQVVGRVHLHLDCSPRNQPGLRSQEWGVQRPEVLMTMEPVPEEAHLPLRFQTLAPLQRSPGSLLPLGNCYCQ